MTKFTDEQIIKALECCFTNDFGKTNCNKCAFYTATAKCMDDMQNAVIDLINRQAAEIERLTAKILVKDNINDYNTMQLRIAREELRTAKSEAIKEFAERLTDKISVYSKYVDVDGIVILNRIFRMIEDVEKEMTEVQE